METATTIKRPRGRPRTDAPPRSDVHARLPPTLKARLERDAERAHRSIAKEFEIRLERSYLQDEMYGGPEMAAMFRSMAEVALGYAKYGNRGSFFEDFNVFVFVSNVWQTIIKRHMPRPDEELLDEVCREWDAVKAGSLQTAEQQAAREWLIHHTASQLTLVQLLAGTMEPAVGRSARPSEVASGKLANADAAATGELAMPPGSLFGNLGKALEGPIPSESPTSTALFGMALSGGTPWPVGNVVKAMEGLLPSQGSARAAASAVSRLAELLADLTETGGTVMQPKTRADSNVVADWQ